MNHLLKNVQLMNYNYLVFLQEDDTNLNFYTTGSSKNIEQFYIAYEAVQLGLQEIKNNKTFISLKELTWTKL